MIRPFFIVWLILFSSITQAAVNAEVDRTQIGEGESFTLTLSSDNSSTEKPDLSILDANFDVVSTSNSSNISIINGQMSSQVSWQIQLIPKHVGAIIIPSISIGNEKTQPITIEIAKQSFATNNAPSANNATHSNSNAFFETTVDKTAVYVQGQIVYTQRFYYRPELSIADISVDNLTLEGASIEDLHTKQQPYRKEINGVLYLISEATYVIFPEKSGPLRIPSQTLTVRMQSSMFDPPRQARLVSDEQIVNVLPQPNHINPWLPAKELTINESWSTTPPVFRTGESITRKITVEAEGLSQSHLPALIETKIDGLKMYADKPEVKNNIASGGSGIVGIRTDSVAIVATKAGTYTLPEIKITWWDTDDNIEKVASLPAFTFTVENNPDNNQTTLPAPAVDDSLNSTESSLSTEKYQTDYKNQLWLYVASAFLVLWILTLLLWWRATRQKSNIENNTDVIKVDKPKSNLTKSQAFNEFSLACQNNDPIKTRDALLKWAFDRWPSNAPLTLDDIAIKEPALAEALRALEYALYAKQAAGWQGTELLVLVKKLPPLVAHTKEQKSPLESLYPPS